MLSERRVVDPLRQGFLDAERRLLDRSSNRVEERSLLAGRPPVEIRALVSGSPDDPAVLLVHGGGGTAASWLPLMERLPGWRLVAIDRPGCGMSGEIDYRTVDLRRHAVSLLESVLDGSGLERVAVVGNSMGGLWGFWLALERPERVSALVQLGCPALLLGTSAPVMMRMLSIQGPRPPGPPPPADPRRVVQQVAGRHAADRMGPELMDCLFRADLVWSRGTTRLSIIGVTLTPEGAKPEFELGPDELRRIQQPVLFVWGDRDTYGPPEAGRRAVELLPDARIEVLRAGHLPWLDDVDRCAELAGDFLARYR
jgi:2-hydroxy-6-oxonona-2,4-dienedioate hydrolase